MKIMQFGFGAGGDRRYLPHNCTQNCVAMTGGHDNDTTRAFFEKAKYKKSDVYAHARKYLSCSGRDIVFELVRSAYASCANTVVIPMQDILNLGGEARMNLPGTLAGNWMWRFTWDQVSDKLPMKYRKLAALCDRLPGGR